MSKFRIKLYLLIITDNLIKILYESLISSIPFWVWELKDFWLGEFKFGIKEGIFWSTLLYFFFFFIFIFIFYSKFY